MRTVAAIPALGLLAGTAFGLLVPDLSPTNACVLLSASAVAAAWAWCAARSRVLAAAVSLGFVAGGAALSATAWQRAWGTPLRAAFEDLARAERDRSAAEAPLLPLDEEVFATVEGVLRSDASPGAAGVSLRVDVDGIAGQMGRAGGIIVTVVGALAASHVDEWRAGRRVRMPVQLYRASRYFDPGVPDYERALARRGTTLVGTVKSGALVEVLAAGGWMDERLAAVRGHARRAIAAAVGRWSSRSAAIVSAIVIGDRAGLDDDVRRRLQEAGTYHVIAISGGNIAILAGLLLALFRLAGVLGRNAMVVAIVLLCGYANLVGRGASVDRATLMAVVYFAARTIDQRSPPLNTLALAAACLVAADPLSVADPAFVLTCGATLAILTVVPVIHGWAWPRGTRSFGIMFAASLATEALLLPIGAFVFSRVTFAGLALNFLAIPLMSVAQLAGMAVVPVALVSARLAMACGWVAHAGADGLVRSADLAQFVPGLISRVAPPNVLVCTIYYTALAACWALWRQRVHTTGSAESACVRGWRFGTLAVAALSALWIVAEPWTLRAARGDGRLRVTFIDVGQGDAAFVRFPRGSTLLVDAGGLSTSSTFDIGERVVAPVLRDAGVRRLDYLALTHGDPDHIGGAASVIDEFRPREVWEGIPVPRSAPLTALRLQVEAQHLRWARVRRGDHAVIDGVEVRALHPDVPDWERQKVRNDDSVVLDLRWRDVSVLFTGDVGKAIERVLGGSLEPARLRVIKVPHHGSLTSSSEDFVHAIHPDIAVVSAGRRNHFGHPVPAVLDRYRAAGTQIFRTDRDGAVTVDTDGYTLHVSTFLGTDSFVRTAGNHEDTKGTKQ